MRGLIAWTFLALLALAACGDDHGSDVPQIAGASLATDEDAPVAHSVEASDPAGRELVLEAQAPMHGSVAIDRLRLTYTPSANYNGRDSFTVTVSNGVQQASAQIEVMVRPVNDAPSATDDTFAATEDMPLVVPHAALLANDVDVDGDTLSVMSVGSATHGTVASAGTDVTFTPAANFSGAASFQYTITDGKVTSTATVTVNVGGANDAPVAVDDTATTQEDTSLDIAAAVLVANDTDAEGQTLMVTGVGNATHGTVALASGTVTFTPDANFNGTATFEYTVSDGAATDTGTVTVTVTPVNDAPVAVDDTATTAEDTPLMLPSATLVANDIDVEAQALTVTAVGNATHGTVALAAGVVTFTPAADFNGTATFEYTVSDGTDSDTGAVAITVTAVNDAPVAGDDTASVKAGNSLVLTHAELLANDTDADGPSLAITGVQNAANGTAVLGASTITFTPDPGFTGTATFDYVVSDGTDSDVGTVAVTVLAGPTCGDGAVASPEECDDGDTDAGDGCSATCTVEPGWSCSGSPSTCVTICGDGIRAGSEACDDGNLDETDGCTTQCILGAPCTAAALPGGDRFSVDPATGHCYASFDDEMTTFDAAQAACVAAGGYLTTITSAAEQGFAHAVQNPAQNPWIGATDDEVDDDAIFDWVTDEPFGYASFAPGQPDDDAADGGHGECLHMLNAAGEWNDTNCKIDTFVVGRICELEPDPCGDSVLQPMVSEECDDGNNTNGDGCSATCQLEIGCGNGTLDPGEQCDDDNTASGDGCSATCQAELISIAVTPGPITIDRQQRVQLKAIGTFFGGATADVTASATWTTSDAAVAIVGSGGVNNGRVDSLTAAGSATISATVGAIVGTAAVNVRAATCNIRINEVQVHGDGASPASDEFTELVNPCTFTIDVSGWTLVYRSAAGTVDATGSIVTLAGTMAPGAFRFYVGFGYNGGGTPDGMIATGTSGTYSQNAGAMAVRSGPANTGAIVDSVAYGNATNAFVEGTPASVPPANRSIYRSPFDGNDTNVNANDFVLTDPSGPPPGQPTPGKSNFR